MLPVLASNTSIDCALPVKVIEIEPCDGRAEHELMGGVAPLVCPRAFGVAVSRRRAGVGSRRVGSGGSPHRVAVCYSRHSCTSGSNRPTTMR
jgi:hypothetical protein